ncbi:MULTISPECIES: NAD(P)(+) transhydrogenase (Re/Si-specific) subunit beta [Lactobacillaceae]|uniref:NAD(P)(+) transhydrogenase (Re/Si-specific) subunit beta n=1 Tax=Lactobacillaceae TaxID=33958 RepID=UPI0014565895|nr:NAD(P)(+) transhydrogenase (Re/Si-specific) subunit beta [Lactobacillus sp. HBUAS51381]NLR09381.1 NAD(P)(+) transhydrogenase (Re/Si-specific) subunit beta [Lactobacillus sp. HBUAS51381]
MSTLQTIASLIYLISAVCYVLGVHMMRSPKTARKGNGLSAIGMFMAVIMIIIEVVADGKITATGWIVLIAGLAVGIAYGVVKARKVPMTDVPQLVSLFNAVGGGAAAVIGIFDYLMKGDGVALSLAFSIPVFLDVIIGGITFSGSLIATGKLSGKVPGKPITFPGAKLVNIIVVLGMLVAAWFMLATPTNIWFVVLGLVMALIFGLLMTLPIGGADMPVVVSLLNAFTGLAVAFAGFVINNQVLIIAGALVGAAGTILTLQMAEAMNRSVANILAGGFGTGDSDSGSAGPDVPVDVKETSADDIGLQLAYAQNVMIVPGYGLAAAQAQHEVAELATVLTEKGINVNYAIHPVAGRMPGHMNVLLADVNVPYDQMKQLDDANPMFESTDVSLVIGANDVTNPLARESGNEISGMPILDVDKSKSVVVIKRSMSTGYAGIQNPLFSLDNTQMFFSDAKVGLQDIVAATKQYLED